MKPKTYVIDHGNDSFTIKIKKTLIVDHIPWCTQLRDTSVRLASVSIFFTHWKAEISTLLRAFHVFPT